MLSCVAKLTVFIFLVFFFFLPTPFPCLVSSLFLHLSLVWNGVRPRWSHRPVEIQPRIQMQRVYLSLHLITRALTMPSESFGTTLRYDLPGIVECQLHHPRTFFG